MADISDERAAGPGVGVRRRGFMPVGQCWNCAAGATRIGTSSGVAVMEEKGNARDGYE